jgi:hypothetical protein
MGNVDSKLHDDGDVRDRASETPKRGLLGAHGAVFKGERSTPNRTTDFVDGAAAGAVNSTTRPTGRTVYRGNGIAGGSVVGYPAQRTGQRAAAATGEGKTAAGAAAAFTDRRSTGVGEGGRALGSDGRGTMWSGFTADKTIGTPTLQGDETGFAVDVVEVVDGSAAIDVDVHADTVTKYPSGTLEILVYARGTDTDEDEALVGKNDWPLSTTQSEAYGASAGPAALAAGTYAVYVRFITQDGAVGPLSNRYALTIA